MKEIKLTKGKITLVDDEDYKKLNKYKWNASNHGRMRKDISYAQRTIIDNNGKKYNLYIHRAILSLKKGQMVDHINGDTLDNRKHNLRVCINRENLINVGKCSTNTSGYKGVCWDKRTNKWIARIHSNNKVIYLGGYKNIKDANSAYINAARLYHGKFINLKDNV